MTNVSSSRGISKDPTIANTPVKIQIVENTLDFQNIPGALYYDYSAESLISQIKKAANGRPIKELTIIGHAGDSGIGPIREEIFRNPSRFQNELNLLQELKPSDFAPNAVVKLDGCFVGYNKYLLQELSKLWKVRVQAATGYQFHGFHVDKSIAQENITTRAERYGNDGTTNNIEKEPFRGFEGTIIQAIPSSTGEVTFSVDNNELAKDKCYQSDLYRRETQHNNTTCNGISEEDVARFNTEQAAQKKLQEEEAERARAIEAVAAPMGEGAKFLGQMSLSIGGGMGGTALGAFLGTLVCPGIGTAIGAALFGALGSGGAKAVSQQVFNGKVNWKEVLADAALGGVSGGTSGWVQGIKQLPKIMAAMKGGKEVLGSKFAFSKTGEFITQTSRLINADNIHKHWLMNAFHRGVVNTGQGLTYKMLAGEEDLFNWQSMASDVVLGEFIHHGAKIIRPERNQGRHSSEEEILNGTWINSEKRMFGLAANENYNIQYAEYTTPIEMQRSKEYSVFTNDPRAYHSDSSYIAVRESFSEPILPFDEDEIRWIRTSTDGERDIEVFGHPWLALARAKSYRLEDVIKAKYSKLQDFIKTECGKLKNAALEQYKKLEDVVKAEYSKLEEFIKTEYGKLQESIKTKYNEVQDSTKAKYNKFENSIKTKYSQTKHSIEMKLPAFQKLKRKMLEPPEYSRKDSLNVSKVFKDNPGALLNNVLAKLSLNSNNFKDAIKDANLLLRHEFFEAIEVQNGSSIPSFNGQHWKDFLTGVLNSEVISTEQKIKVAQNLNSTLVELLILSKKGNIPKRYETLGGSLQNIKKPLDRQNFMYSIAYGSKTDLHETLLGESLYSLEPCTLLPNHLINSYHNRIIQIPLDQGTHASLTFFSESNIAFLELPGQPGKKISLSDKQLIPLGNNQYIRNSSLVEQKHGISESYGRYELITKIPNKTSPFHINEGESHIDIGNNENIILRKEGGTFDYMVGTSSDEYKRETYVGGNTLKDNHKFPIRDSEFLIYDSQTQDFRIVHQVPNKKEPYSYHTDWNHVEPFTWKNTETRFSYYGQEVSLIPQEANGKILIQFNGHDYGYWSINPGQSSHIRIDPRIGLNFDPKTNKVTVIHSESSGPVSSQESHSIDHVEILGYKVGDYEINYEVIHHPNPDYEHGASNQLRLYGINNTSAKERVPKISIVRSDGSITNIDFTVENLISFHYRKEAIINPGDHLYLDGRLIQLRESYPLRNRFDHQYEPPTMFVEVADREINLSVKEHNININNVSLKFKTIGEDKTFSLTSSYPFITVISPGKTPYSHTIAGSNSFNFQGIKDGDILQWSDADGNLLGNMKVVANNNGVEVKPLPKDQVPKAVIPNVRVSKQFDFDGKMINLNGVKMVGAKDTTLYLQSLSGLSESSKIFIVRQGERIPLFINLQGNLHIGDTHLTPILYPNDKLEITDTKYKKLIDFNLIM